MKISGVFGNDHAVLGQAPDTRPAVIWLWRHTHDTSPSGFVSRLEGELSRGHKVTQYNYLPYSAPERWILRLLRGPGQPAYFYRLTEIR